MPGEFVSLDATGPLRIRSVHGNRLGLIFIDHCTNTPFVYAMESKNEYPKYLKQLLIDFRDSFKGLRVCEIRVLRSDNASEFNSAEVKQIYLDHAIKRHFSPPGRAGGKMPAKNQGTDSDPGDKPAKEIMDLLIP